MTAGLTNLQQRVVSALVLAGAVLLATWLGGPIFRLVVCLVAAIVFLEWLTMAQGDLQSVRAPVLVAFGAAIVVLLLGAGPLASLIAALVAGAIGAIVAETRRQGFNVAQGFAYAFLPAYAMVVLRGESQTGLVAVLFLYAVVWATDIGAYFVGRKLGGPKLAPAISPGKTWSGAAGGLAAGILAGMLLTASAGSFSASILVAALLISLAAQLGDLFESSIKRQAGVKDSSQLIPGHGGAMDRVDGLAFAAVALLILAMLGLHPGIAHG